MKTISDLEREFSTVKARRVPRDQKLPLVRSIRGGVSEIEKKAASDFSFPLQEIQKARAFLVVLDDYLRP
jgi:hypothetical protein